MALADFGGAIRLEATVCEAAEILFLCEVNNARFHRFPVRQILRHLNTTTSIGEAVKFLKNLPQGVVFPKSRNWSQNFQFLRLQAVITTQRLQIAGNKINFQMIPLRDV